MADGVSRNENEEKANADERLMKSRNSERKPKPKRERKREFRNALVLFTRRPGWSDLVATFDRVRKAEPDARVFCLLLELECDGNENEKQNENANENSHSVDQSSETGARPGARTTTDEPASQSTATATAESTASTAEAAVESEGNAGAAAVESEPLPDDTAAATTRLKWAKTATYYAFLPIFYTAAYYELVDAVLLLPSEKKHALPGYSLVVVAGRQLSEAELETARKLIEYEVYKKPWFYRRRDRYYRGPSSSDKKSDSDSDSDSDTDADWDADRETEFHRRQQTKSAPGDVDSTTGSNPTVTVATGADVQLDFDVGSEAKKAKAEFCQSDTAASRCHFQGRDKWQTQQEKPAMSEAETGETEAVVVTVTVTVTEAIADAEARVVVEPAKSATERVATLFVGFGDASTASKSRSAAGWDGKVCESCVQGPPHQQTESASLSSSQDPSQTPEMEHANDAAAEVEQSSADGGQESEDTDEFEDEKEHLEDFEKLDDKLKSPDYVRVSGTFDRLHYGHKLLISCAALLAQKSLAIVVPRETDGKKFADLLFSYSKRCWMVAQFLRFVKPSVYHDQENYWIGRVCIESEEDKEVVQVFSTQKKRNRRLESEYVGKTLMSCFIGGRYPYAAVKDAYVTELYLPFLIIEPDGRRKLSSRHLRESAFEKLQASRQEAVENKKKA